MEMEMGGKQMNNNQLLYAAIDMGTNSFKLLITTNRLLPILRLNSSVTLSSPISQPDQLRAISALTNFHNILISHNILPSNTRYVATSAIRQSLSHSQHFLTSLCQTIGPNFTIHVLSGEDEARFTYLGVSRSFPNPVGNVLVVDIGGGSTEFVVGNGGRVLFGASVLLGHVNLTRRFFESGCWRIDEMRDHVRCLVRESGILSELDRHGFEVVIGSSGTARAIEKAIYNGYGRKLNAINASNFVYNRDWNICMGDLSDLVKKLCCVNGEMEREKVFKKRSKFIVAAAVLLEELFEMLKIKVMEVSRYSLCEGVLAERLAGSLGNYDVDAGTRWRSVVFLATRYNSKKKMRSAALCAVIAKEIFESVRKWNKVGDGEYRLGVSFHDSDLEYLEAACLLHSIGVIAGKKGYHKQSYRIIMSGGHLHGYDIDEIKIVALLSRHHRKKFPELDHHSLNGFTKEFKQKFRILCAILRVSIVVQQFIPVSIQDIRVWYSQECFNMVLGEPSYQPVIPNIQTSPEDADREIAKALEIFSEVLQQKLTVLVPSSSLQSSERRAFTDDAMTSQI